MAGALPIVVLEAPLSGPESERRNGRGAGSRAPGRFRMGDAVQAGLLVLLTGNLGRLPTFAAGSKTAPLLLNDVAVLALALAGAVLAMRGRRLRLDGPAAWGLAFAAVGGLSAVLAVPRFGLTPGQAAFSLAYLVRWLAYFTVYLVVVNWVRRADIPSTLRTFQRCIVYFAAFGIFQAIFLPGFAQLVYPESALYTDWDPQGHRLVSTFLDPNYAGAFIVMGLLLAVARLSYGARVPGWQLFVLLLALLLTVSRSSILAFLVGAGVIVATRGISKRVVRFAAVLVLLVIPLLPRIVDYAVSLNKLSIDNSAMMRVISWVRALEILADHPIIGVGFNTYGFVRRLYGHEIEGASSFGLDGGLLFIAVITGFVGLFCYCTMIALVWRRCRRVWRDAAAPPEERALCVGAVAATGALLVHSLFLNSLLYPFLMQPLWILWGLTFHAGGAVPHRAPVSVLRIVGSPPVLAASGAGGR